MCAPRSHGKAPRQGVPRHGDRLTTARDAPAPSRSPLRPLQRSAVEKPPHDHSADTGTSGVGRSPYSREQGGVRESASGPLALPPPARWFRGTFIDDLGLGHLASSSRPTSNRGVAERTARHLTSGLPRCLSETYAVQASQWVATIAAAPRLSWGYCVRQGPGGNARGLGSPRPTGTFDHSEGSLGPGFKFMQAETGVMVPGLKNGQPALVCNR